MRESHLLSHIFARSADLSAAFPHVLLGPGDDCAVVRTSSGDQVLLKVDQVVEGRHFAQGTSVDLIARKAVARAVSDIAAMAGTPAWGMAAAVIPAGYARADELFDRTAHWARHFGAPLVGGDISTGASGSALVLGITLGGTPAPGRGPVLRSGAQPGDEVWVTGKIGGSLASGRHLTFEPRVREGRWLADTLVGDLHAMIDLSDGLGRDAGRIAERSGVRVVIEGSLIPLHVDVDSVRAGVADGEDYELLFCCSPEVMERALASAGGVANPPATLFTRIGHVVTGSGCALALPEGRNLNAKEMGWDH